jgi:hypothetical protein
MIPADLDAFETNLCVFSADSPLSTDWVPHPANPVVVTSAVSRNGGFVRDEDGVVLRARQRQGFDRYGESLSLARITKLDDRAYEEQFDRNVLPDFFPGIEGTHHMHSNGAVTVFDFVREERVR